MKQECLLKLCRHASDSVIIFLLDYVTKTLVVYWCILTLIFGIALGAESKIQIQSQATYACILTAGKVLNSTHHPQQYSIRDPQLYMENNSLAFKS